jgi:hypothetical protein
VLATTETGLLDEADTVGLTTYQAEAVAKQAKRIARETEDQTLAKTIGSGSLRACARPPAIGPACWPSAKTGGDLSDGPREGRRDGAAQ